MKKIVLPLLLACLCASCSMKTYYQVYQTKPVEENSCVVEDNAVVFRNEQVEIRYNFFSEHGLGGFLFTNLTNSPIYLQLDQSCFVLNGMAYDYYQGRGWEEEMSETTTVTFQRREGEKRKKREKRAMTGIEQELQRGNATTAGSSATRSQTTSRAEKAVVMIPPHASKLISEFNIKEEMIPLCGVKETPMGSKSSGQAFTAETSPVTFGNYITYRVGDNSKNFNVSNNFYVSEITNVGTKGMIIEVREKDVCGKEISGKKNVVRTLNYNTPDRFYVTYRR